MKVKDIFNEYGHNVNDKNLPFEMIQMLKHQRIYSVAPDMDIDELIKVSQRLADFENSEKIQGWHYAEAIQYLAFPKKELLNGIKLNFSYLVTNSLDEKFSLRALEEFNNDVKRKIASGLITEKEVNRVLKK